MNIRDILGIVAKRHREDNPLLEDYKVDIIDWNFENDLTCFSELFQKAVVHCANEALKYAAEYDVRIESDESGDSLFVMLPLGSEDFGPRWCVSFADMIRLEIEMAQDEFDSSRRIIRAWRANMLKLVTEIDDALASDESVA